MLYQLKYCIKLSCFTNYHYDGHISQLNARILDDLKLCGKQNAKDFNMLQIRRFILHTQKRRIIEGGDL